MEWRFVDGPEDPGRFFAGVLPREGEAFRPQYGLAREALARGPFAPELSAWVMAGKEPAGLALAVGDAPELVVGVKEGWRRRGIGTALVRAVCDKLRRAGVEALVARAVSNANAGAVRLLESAGFVATATGRLRMRRPLGRALPVCELASGYALRTLAEGEEGAYVGLKNACFPESLPWAEADFRAEFLNAPFAAYERIFVAERAGQLVGTASAWEHDMGDGPVGLVHWVGVDPDHRGRGLGEALTARVLAALAARGYGEAWLNTSRDRAAAVRLYGRLGFAEHRELYDYRLAW